MAEQSSGSSRASLEQAFAMLAEEQSKLVEFQRRMNEATTTVESANKVMTATFDGRGELVRMVFNNTRYRTMAPAELASLLLETLQRGRGQAFAKISEMAGREALPGMSFGDLAAGKVDLSEMAGSMLSSVLDLPRMMQATEGKGGAPDAR
ncbi:YbaB/EbfC family nucleoid-associated protein [Micromonospora sp. KLBMP9576]|uniref:YbaB/EbfC family nucleoid-associated protein n=1 Tax=Micromonospora sp. KLBMP9576 TaxID=3424769 RepID=UPI003D8B67CC